VASKLPKAEIRQRLGKITRGVKKHRFFADFKSDEKIAKRSLKSYGEHMEKFSFFHFYYCYQRFPFVTFLMNVFATFSMVLKSASYLVFFWHPYGILS
jgi:hypothetical protein